MLQEFALIERYFKTLARPSPSVLLGIGDDCALLAPTANQALAVSIDTQVEGVHFPVGAAAEHVGTRVACCALSDLAAMGATPLWATLALTLPYIDEDWLDGFSRGLGSVFAHYNLSLVGGDTTRGPLTITLQVHGSVAANKVLTRHNAQAGELICVTGCLGDGAAALAVIQGKFEPSAQAAAYLRQRFYRPEPCIEVGLALAGIASSAIDISDGSLADLSHILSASKVGAQINLETLPINPIWAASAGAEQAQNWALFGGDDYQLCFTLPAHHLPQLQQSLHTHITPIGVINAGAELVCLRHGQVVHPEGGGFAHFG